MPEHVIQVILDKSFTVSKNLKLCFNSQEPEPAPGKKYTKPPQNRPCPKPCKEIFELFMGLKTGVKLTFPQPGQRGGGET